MTTDANNPDTFTARLSQLRHDLRTPVGHILGYAELIEEDMTEAERNISGHDLQAIHGAGQKMLALVDVHFGASKSSLNDIDLHDAQFQLRMQLNHIAGYTEMLREDAIDGGNEALLGDLDHISDAQRNVVRMLKGMGPLLIDAEDEAPPSEVPDEAVSHATEAGVTGLGGEILIVDDDPANRELLTRRMERSGYVGTSVASGQEALDLLKTRKFDLILLDQIMEGMSGLETLQAIQDTPRLRKIPVIMLSAADASDLAVQCILSGAEDYVAKREIVLLTTSVTNQCRYCVAGHSYYATAAGLDEDSVHRLRQSSPLDDPGREALRLFSQALARGRGHDAGTDLARFRRQGFTRSQTLDVIVGVAAKTLSNMTATLLDLPLDEAFRPYAWLPEPRGAAQTHISRVS